MARPPQVGFAPRQLSRGATYLLGLLALLFVVSLFGGKAVQAFYESQLIATPGGVFGEWKLWTLLTTSFVYPLGGAGLQLLLDGLVIWFMAPTLERWWGTRRWVTFLFATSIIGSLGAALVGLALGWSGALIFGLSPFIWGSLVAFGVLFARQPVQLFGAIPIQGRSLAIGAAALLVLMTLFNQNWVAFAGSAVGMLVALLMTSGGFAPNLWMLKLRRWWLTRKFGVMDGGRAKKPVDKKWMN
jgi:membrane associated rhomboid family serine protease